ncbi:erythromycin esterase family protein [Deinococcus budaensis]|uniref:Erythromycin esterase-like protein n=1 Tax=Deinococcus budaensis TaxID=1665626 RepID=A0A7W8LPT4_9DEIO|nr:erythromycin esterase family protein [Deinococcus budaensis]MBB5233947.1 erythromycin esterase-like protein [Deinococcus budaensis]
MSDRIPRPPGWDMTEPRRALSAFLDALPARPQLLGLGEPTHGVDAFPAWRNRIFQALVEDHGFRSIALESDIVAGLRVDAHVTAGQGTLDGAMQGSFSHGFGGVQANRDLVAWMRIFNTGRERADQLRFYGFDPPLEWWAPSPRASLLALHAFLSEQLDSLPVDRATLERLCGDDARWADPAAVMDAAQSIGNSREARQLRLLADDLWTLLQTSGPGLADHPDVWEAQLQARTAVGLLRYHAGLADPAPNYRRLERGSALRDLMMADHLGAIAEREGGRGPTLVFAHNVHLQRPRSTMKLGDWSVAWWSAGAHVSRRLGTGYAFIASALGTAPDRGIGDPAPDTPEGALVDPAHPATLYASRELTAALPGGLATRTDLPAQAGYFPLEVEGLALTDGVLMLNRAAD